MTESNQASNASVSNPAGASQGADDTYTGIPAEELGSDVPFPQRGEPGAQGEAGSVIDNSTQHEGDTPAGEQAKDQ